MTYHGETVMTHAKQIPLNELGKMFYALECMGYPVLQRTWFQLRGGSVDIALLRKAYLAEAERHPIFKSVIQELPSSIWWNLCWSPLDAVDAAQAVRLCDLSKLTSQEAEKRFQDIEFDAFINYSSKKNPPFFMVLCAYPDGSSRLITFFHHAAADSGGCLMFLKSLFETYGSLVENGERGQDHSAAGGLSPVMTSPLLPASLPGRIKGFFQGAGILLKHALLKKGEAAKLLYGKASSAGSINAVCREISPERMALYLAAARQLEATFTSFFCAAQARALERWKKQRREPCGTISMQVHKNLRASEAEAREVQNKFSVFFLVARKSAEDDPAQLVRCLHRQSRLASGNRMAEKLVYLLWPINFKIAKACLPLWINFLFNNPKVGDSFQVSNIGRVWAGKDGKTQLTRLGDAEITACHMSGHPMASMGTFTSFLTFRETLFLSFNYCTWALPRDDAERFVDLIMQALDDMTCSAPEKIEQKS